MIFGFMPIVVSYAEAFHTVNLIFIVRSIVVLAFIVSVTSALGLLLAIVAVWKVKGREYLASIAGLGIFFIILLEILRLIFPPQLDMLYSSSTKGFWEIFNTLPLSNPALPSRWFAEIITKGFGAPSVITVVLCIAIISISLHIVSKRFWPAVMKIFSRPYRQHISNATVAWFEHTRFPLVLKDILSITRLPQEAGYGMFLLSIAVFFFFFLAAATKGEFRYYQWQAQLNIFSLAWLLFFITALLLRFIFPLMAREGPSVWFLFTQPVTRDSIVAAKMLFAFCLSLPLTAFAAVVWIFLPFASGYRSYLTGISIMVICCLSLIHALLGAIFPNFSDGFDAEKVSTSGMGLVTCLVSLAIASGSCMIAGKLFSGEVSGYQTAIIVCGISIGAVGTLWLTMRRIISSYEW